VSGGEDGSSSFDSFVAETNAQAARLVAQLARLDARGVLDVFLCCVPVRAHDRVVASRAMTGTGH
jgi:hypothetical protein